MDAEQILRWFAGLARPYQLLVAGAVLVGMMSLMTSMALSNPWFLLIAAFWFFVAPATVALADARE
ncbi:MAG: hypothetical protein ABEH88_12250 [Halobacteriales archaeon]